MGLVSRLGLVSLIATIWVGVDQLTKVWAVNYLASTPTLSYLRGFLKLHYAENTGGFLGLGAGIPAGVRFGIFTVLVAGILLALLVFILRTKLPVPMIIAFSLVFSGGVGNLLDRVFNEGRVVDFLILGVGPLQTGIFNVADMAVVAGVLLLFVFGLKYKDFFET